jgi:NTE family protein
MGRASPIPAATRDPTPDRPGTRGRAAGHPVRMAPFDGRPPEVLVLGGGGTLGEAWMTGVLAGLRDATGFDPRGCRAFVGTSAGSIVAASLASGRAPRRPGAGERPEARAASGQAAAGRRGTAVLGRAAGALVGLAAPAGLAAAAPAGAFVRAAVLGRVPDGRRSLDPLRAEVERWGASWDGRLRVCTVQRGSGRRVVFGSRDAPSAGVGEAVAASCAIPGVFAPVRIGGREYVDGGAWSPVNADAAPAGRGDRVLVLEPTAVLLRGALRPATAVESLALRRRGAHVHAVAPDAGAAPLMGRLMDPDRGGRVLAAGYRQGRALGG